MTITNYITLKETFSLLKFMASKRNITITTFRKALTTRLEKKGAVIKKGSMFLSEDEKAISKFVEESLQTFINYNMITTVTKTFNTRCKSLQDTTKIKLTEKGLNVKC